MACQDCVWFDPKKQKSDDPYCLNLCDGSKILPRGYVPIVACMKGRMVSRKYLRKDFDCEFFERCGQLMLEL